MQAVPALQTIEKAANEADNTPDADIALSTHLARPQHYPKESKDVMVHMARGSD